MLSNPFSPGRGRRRVAAPMPWNDKAAVEALLGQGPTFAELLRGAPLLPVGQTATALIWRSGCSSTTPALILPGNSCETDCNSCSTTPRSWPSRKPPLLAEQRQAAIIRLLLEPLLVRQS